MRWQGTGIGFSYPYLLTNQFYHQKKGFGIFTRDQGPMFQGYRALM